MPSIVCHHKRNALPFEKGEAAIASSDITKDLLFNRDTTTYGNAPVLVCSPVRCRIMGGVGGLPPPRAASLRRVFRIVLGIARKISLDCLRRKYDEYFKCIVLLMPIVSISQRRDSQSYIDS
jgi:hypothetical protein